MQIAPALFFFVVRLLVIVLALYVAYIVTKRVIEPYVLRPTCLTNTNSCAYITMYKYHNSFVGQAFPSGIWLWFNGKKLYVYGQAPGICEHSDYYDPVDVIEVSGTNLETVYSRKNYECITKITDVVTYYQAVLKAVDPVTVYIRSGAVSDSININVFDIFEQLINQGIISVENI